MPRWQEALLSFYFYRAVKGCMSWSENIFLNLIEIETQPLQESVTAKKRTPGEFTAVSKSKKGSFMSRRFF